MPYLDQENRERVEANGPSRAGDLNYLITRLAIDYLVTISKGWKGEPNYEAVRDTLAEIHEAEQEMRRRLLAPYEDHKRNDNGDVYADVLARYTHLFSPR